MIFLFENLSWLHHRAGQTLGCPTLAKNFAVFALSLNESCELAGRYLKLLKMPQGDKRADDETPDVYILQREKKVCRRRCVALTHKSPTSRERKVLLMLPLFKFAQTSYDSRAMCWRNRATSTIDNCLGQ